MLIFLFLGAAAPCAAIALALSLTTTMHRLGERDTRLPPLRGLNRRPRNAPLYFSWGSIAPPHPLRYFVSLVGEVAKYLVRNYILRIANRNKAVQ